MAGLKPWNKERAQTVCRHKPCGCLPERLDPALKVNNVPTGNTAWRPCACIGHEKGKPVANTYRACTNAHLLIEPQSAGWPVGARGRHGDQVQWAGSKVLIADADKSSLSFYIKT